MATLKNGEFIDDVLEYYESTEAERTGSPVDKEIKLMKSKLSIDDLIAKYVSLKVSKIDIKEKTGDCPFTDCTGEGAKNNWYIKVQDVGPFVVNQVNEMFCCFDCDKEGDHITFISTMEKLTPKDAFNFIITKYNLDIPYKN
jgi:DNA primase